MDTDVVKTFIEVASTGSFGQAAEHLNVAQTTVSARIKKLEAMLGKQLLIRRKTGAELTRAGSHFLRQAPAFVQLGERLKGDLSIPAGFDSILSLGGEVNLATTWMKKWVRKLRSDLPDTALRVKIDIPIDLIDRFSEGLIDAALMHAPPAREGLKSDLVGEEHLILVTTDCSIRSVDDHRFVYVDWGEAFSAAFRRSHPNFDGSPALSFDHGPLALDFILENGGAAYVRRGAALPYLKSFQISVVEDAVKFSHPVYIVRPADIPNPTLDQAIGVLRNIVSEETSRDR